MVHSRPRSILLALVLLVAPAVHSQELSSLLHNPPDQVQPGQAFVVDGVLTGTQRILRMVLRYRGPGEPYTEAPMELQYGDLYRGVIPGSHMVSPGIEYYVEGYAIGGERVPLFKSATRPARIVIGGGEPPARPAPVTRAPEPAPRATEPVKPPPEPVKPSRPEPTAKSEPTARPEPARPSPKSEPVAKPEPGRRAEPGRKSEPPARGGPSDDALAALTADLPADAEPAGSRPAPTRPARASEPAAPSEPTHHRSQMEEDLALYTAEDTLALATRHEESVKKVPAIASSFGREQIRALGARTVADVLDVVPGLTISRDVQGFHRTSVRGLRNDAEVLFLLNGHRLNNFFDGKALMNLPVENLERIEVIRGPGSSLYGAGAFLGVVNLVTQREEGVLSSASVGGVPQKLKGQDEFAPAADLHLSGAHAFEHLKLFADGDAWYQKGGAKAVETDALAADTLSQGLRQPLEPVGYTQDDRVLLNLGLGAEYALSETHRVTASFRVMHEDRAALLGLFDTVGPGSRLKWLVLLGDLSYERQVNDRVRLRARAGWDRQASDRLFKIGPDRFRTGPDDATQYFANGMQEQTLVTVSTLGANVDVDMSLFEGNRLSLGVVGELQTLDDYEYLTNYTSDSRRRPSLQAPTGLVDIQEIANGAAARRLSFGAFAQDQWTVVEPLTLTLGVRADVTQLPSVSAQGAITGTELVPSINPRVGLVFSATDSLVLKLLYGRAFRPPTLQELLEQIPNTYYNQGRFSGNPSLRPAVVDTLELGADLIQTAGEARVRLRGNAFYEGFSNPIAAVDTSGNIVPLRNRELGVRVYGLEGEARLEASKRATAWVNASLFRAEDLELPANHLYLTDTPQARFNAGISMPIGDLINFDLVVRAGAERRNNTRSVLELVRRYKIPAYNLITAQVRTEPIADHFELAFVVQNVFDFDQRDDVPRPDRIPNLLPREGLSAFLTLRAHH